MIHLVKKSMCCFNMPPRSLMPSFSSEKFAHHNSEDFEHSKQKSFGNTTFYTILVSSFLFLAQLQLYG